MENGNLSFIDELGMGEPTEATETSETTQEENSPNEDFVQEPTEQTVATEKEVQEDTEPDELGEIRKQMEVMQKRIDDKDKYIQELREKSMQQEEAGSDEEEGVDEEDDFWEDPVGKYKSLQQQMQIQQMQIQETIYANTVDNYWKTVNQDALKEAVATDTEFAQKFNTSNEPYKVAYEYLVAKQENKSKSENQLREQIRKELLAEMKTTNKETVPNVARMSGKSDGSASKNLEEDGFMAIYGRK